MLSKLRFYFILDPLLATTQHNQPYSSLTLAPLVDQQRWWFCISRFDPGWEQASLVCFIPQVLVQVSISYLLQGLHIIHWHQVAVQVHELDTHLQK